MKKRLLRFFIDENYTEMIKSYEKTDAYLIIVIFCMYIAVISINLFIRRIFI